MPIGDDFDGIVYLHGDLTQEPRHLIATEGDRKVPTGIGLHTPAAVHYGHAAATTVARQHTLDTAWAAHPERFAQRPQLKTLQLPEAAWSNKPLPEPAQEPLLNTAA